MDPLAISNMPGPGPRKAWGPLTPIDRSRVSGILGGPETEAQRAVEKAAAEAPKPTGKAAKGGGGKSRVAAWEDELREMQEAEGSFFAGSKQRALEFWRERLAQAEKGSQEYLAVRRKVFELEKQTARERLEGEIADLKGQQEALKGDAEEKLRIQQEITAKVKAAYGEESKEYKSAKREEVRVAREVQEQINRIKEIGHEQEKELARLDLDLARENLNFRREMHRIAEAEELEGLRKLLDQELEIERNHLLKRRELHKHDKLQTAEINKQLEVLEKQYQLRTQQADHQLILKKQGLWGNFFSNLKSGFNQLISGMLSGTATFGQVMGGIFQNLAATIGASLLEMALEWVKAILTGKEALFGFMKNIISGKAAQAAASTYASVAEIPVVGWLLAPAAAAGAFAAVAAFGGMVPSAAGGWDIPADALALVHKKEMILPEHLAERVRNMTEPGGGGQGAQVNITITALDSRDVKRFFRTHGDALTAVLKGKRRDFAF